MKSYNSVLDYPKNQPSVVTIGSFDGVHLGHQEILKQLQQIAENEHLHAVLLTFYPHPRSVVQAHNPVQILTPLAEKKAKIAAIGIQNLVVHPFTKAFSRLTAREYVKSILVDGLQAKKIIIGYDHRFGRNRTANLETLKEFGVEFDFEVVEIPAHQINQVAISSTKIRQALLNGQIEKATHYLGSPYLLNGKVIKGKGRGKTLGFPTANLDVSPAEKLIPKHGVYLTKMHWKGTTIYGLTNIGTNPTFIDKEFSVETHFLNFSTDMYDAEIELEFCAYIRDEKKFESPEALQTAVAEDKLWAKAYLRNV